VRGRASDMICTRTDFWMLIGEHRERMYIATGYGLIQCVKALMSYDDKVSAGLDYEVTSRTCQYRPVFWFENALLVELMLSTLDMAAFIYVEL
jgi:hypothetical protein